MMQRKFRVISDGRFVFCLVLTFLLAVVPRCFAQEYNFTTSWGGNAGSSGGAPQIPVDGTYNTDFIIGSGVLSYPHGIAVDGSGNVYIADAYNHVIRKYDSAGAPLSF